MIKEVIELDGHSPSVRFVQSEADRPEDRREEGRVHRLFEFLVQLPVIDEELEREESRDVRLRFFDGAVGLLQFLAHGRRPFPRHDVVRTQAVHQLVHQDVREKHLEVDVGLIGGGQRHLRNRHEDGLEFRVLVVLQHHALGALLGDDALVVRQVECRGLDAAVGVT